MAPLIYACIAPHAGDLIPAAAESQDRIALTRESMRNMGEALEELKPEVIVIIDPHGFRVQNAISVCMAEKAGGEWPPSIQMDFDMDVGMAGAIADRAQVGSLPVVRYIYGASGGQDCYVPLDWGAILPLYFLGNSYDPKPRLVHMSPMRLLPYQTHFEFGRATGQVIKESARRIAFIASADQGHAHDPQGPYGFDPASAEYDDWMQQVIRSGDLERLLSVDAELVEAGKPDSLWPSLVLAGVLKENPLQARLLSYEVNGYFGVLCADFQAGQR